MPGHSGGASSARMAARRVARRRQLMGGDGAAAGRVVLGLVRAIDESSAQLQPRRRGSGTRAYLEVGAAPTWAPQTAPSGDILVGEERAQRPRRRRPAAVARARGIPGTLRPGRDAETSSTTVRLRHLRGRTPLAPRDAGATGRSPLSGRLGGGDGDGVDSGALSQCRDRSLLEMCSAGGRRGSSCPVVATASSFAALRVGGAAGRRVDGRRCAATSPPRTTGRLQLWHTLWRRYGRRRTVGRCEKSSRRAGRANRDGPVLSGARRRPPRRGVAGRRRKRSRCASVETGTRSTGTAVPLRPPTLAFPMPRSTRSRRSARSPTPRRCATTVKWSRSTANDRRQRTQRHLWGGAIAPTVAGAA